MSGRYLRYTLLYEGFDTESDCLWTKGHTVNTRFGNTKLVWQESKCAVAVMSRKTAEKSDFTTCSSLSFVLPPHNLFFVTNRQVILLNKI